MTKHGFSKRATKSAEYVTWIAMKARCYNKRHISYPRYGGRGIAVCSKWLSSFENFIADMGSKPSPSHSIGRADNDKDYGPLNCKWESKSSQQNNTCANHSITFNGETMNLNKWASRIGIKPTTLRARLKRNWSLERALKP